MKWFLIITLMFLATLGMQQAFGQSENKDVMANTMTGVIVESNLIRNPVARFGSTKYRTPSNVTLGLGATIYDNYGSWSVQATATSAYVEWEMLAPSDEHKSGNCVYAASFNGTAANYKLQILDGSAVELASRQLRDVTSTTDIAVFYPCGASRKVRVTYTSTGTGLAFDIGRLQYGRYIGTSVPDGAAWVGSAFTVGTTNCAWSRTNTALGAFTADADCPVPTVTGNMAAPATKIPGFIIPTAKPGIYVIKGISLFTNSGATYGSWAFNDGTTTVYAGNSGSGSSATAIGSIEATFTVTTTKTNWAIQVYGASPSGTVDIGPSVAGLRDLYFNVFYYPLNGTASSDIVPASCINNPDCQNNFSAKVSSTGVVSDENYSFINGNCTMSSGLSACTWDTSRFSVAPNCTINASNTGSGTPRFFNSSTTTSGSSAELYNTSATGTNTQYTITCSRAGSDVKPWGPMPWLTGMVSADDPTSIKASWVFFGSGTNSTSACTSTPCSVSFQIGTNITSVVWEATGIYRLMGIDGTKAACMGTGLGGGVPITLIFDKDTSTTTYARLLARNPSGAATNSAYSSVFCGEKK